MSSGATHPQSIRKTLVRSNSGFTRTCCCFRSTSTSINSSAALVVLNLAAAYSKNTCRSSPVSGLSSQKALRVVFMFVAAATATTTAPDDDIVVVAPLWKVNAVLRGGSFIMGDGSIGSSPGYPSERNTQNDVNVRFQVKNLNYRTISATLVSVRCFCFPPRRRWFQ